MASSDEESRVGTRAMKASRMSVGVWWVFFRVLGS